MLIHDAGDDDDITVAKTAGASNIELGPITGGCHHLHLTLSLATTVAPVHFICLIF